MERICIYLTYDRQKIVDKYIGYMLKELKTCVDHLVVVCNENEVVRGGYILEEYADEIFYRENIGFDAGGFKDALCSFVGWDKVLQYEELVLANDSMFGPFKPMEAIFAEMERRENDFWGLIKHGEGRSDDIGHIPEHIQSFFYVIRDRMLHCSQFRDYWEGMPYFASFHETVLGHEIKFTDYFFGLGYRFDTLADTEINDSANINNNYSQYANLSFELIKKRNFPFLKKQQLICDTSDLQTQENLGQAIGYIDKKTSYDVDLIWDNIIRVFNIADLQRNLHFQYVISQKGPGEKHANAVIIIFIGHKSSAEYVLEYIQELNEGCQVKIFSEYSEYLEDYQKKGFECGISRQDEIVKLLPGFCKYDYVCVMHDADMTSDRKRSCTGKSYFYNVWENLAKNRSHLEGVLNLFAEEPRLGFLAPPQPNFAGYFGEYGKGWGGKFEAVQRMADEAGIACQISRWKPPYRVSDNFWVRGCILERLGDLKVTDISALPYIWSYLSQGAGFYSGTVESAEYASMDGVNMQYYLRQVAAQVRREYGSFDTFIELKEKIFLGAFREFSRKYSRILVYGIGDIAQRHKHLLAGIESYVVTDGQPKPDKLDGVPVKYLSEIEAPENCGVVLCLNENNQEQVMPLLKMRGIANCLCI